MKWPRLGLASLALAASIAVSAQTGQSGMGIYQHGAGADGQPIVAETAGIELTGQHAACANCHRSPLDGGSEGGVIAPALAWDELSARGYGRNALAQTLNSGVAPGGRSLHALMPRYRLSPTDIDALQVYLQQDHALAGVGDDRITIATILPAAPALRGFGEASAAAVARAVDENTDRLFGRRLEHVTLDARLPIIELEGQLEDRPPALVIGSVGLDDRGPIAELLRHRGIANFAPVAALSGTADDAAVFPLLPGLRQQAIALVEQAQTQFGCVDFAFADDAVSLAVVQSLSALVETTTDCPAMLLLAQPDDMGQVLEGLKARRIGRLYVSAEQIGPHLSTLAQSCALSVAAPSRYDLATTVDRNAALAVEVLRDALARSGRRFSRQKLIANLHAAAPPTAAVIEHIDAPEGQMGPCLSPVRKRQGTDRQ
ncbi:hypothetical protein [Aurantiacibacter rhizosphaerae]|uniref:Cytochrome c domain-containing protein n=1 Tax=Aurantiacibacter rhizosphaerae TaxID=2691582 RepID=A0A844XF92_9SPHN|nr:hypothetical protein [Aurantiacibacter rhizosphaerae]MWV28676.1 hypothetical protein [Aurantiacibacter rhizosphaerae]